MDDETSSTTSTNYLALFTVLAIIIIGIIVIAGIIFLVNHANDFFTEINQGLSNASVAFGVIETSLESGFNRLGTAVKIQADSISQNVNHSLGIVNDAFGPLGDAIQDTFNATNDPLLDYAQLTLDAVETVGDALGNSVGAFGQSLINGSLIKSLACASQSLVNSLMTQNICSTQFICDNPNNGTFPPFFS